MVKPAGNHLAFPFRISPNGSMEHVFVPDDHVKQELMQLLLTDGGERLFLPEFGGGVRSFVFKNINDELSSISKSALTQALSKWLGHRLIIEELKIFTEEEKLNIAIKYRLSGAEETRDIMFRHIGK
jgi:phage baseplate assembly protein W